MYSEKRLNSFFLFPPSQSKRVFLERRASIISCFPFSLKQSIFLNSNSGLGILSNNLSLYLSYVINLNPKIENTYSSTQLTDDQQKALTAKLEEVYDSTPKYTNNTVDASKYGGRKSKSKSKRKTRKTHKK